MRSLHETRFVHTTPDARQRTHTAAPHCAATRKPSPFHWRPQRTLSCLTVSPSLHFSVTNLCFSHFSISFLVQFCSGGFSIIRSFSQRSSFLFLLWPFKSPLAIFLPLNPYSRSHTFLKVFYLTTFSFPSLLLLQFAYCRTDSSLKPYQNPAILRTALFLASTRRVVVIPYRHFGTTFIHFLSDET